MGATGCFTSSFGPGDALRALQERAGSSSPVALSIGIHPSLAAATQAGVRQASLEAACGGAEGYLKYVEREIATQRGALGRDEPIARITCGAGVPTPLAAEQLGRLVEIVRRYFALQPEGDFAVEIEARKAPRAVLEALVGLGFNRLQVEAAAPSSAPEEALASAISAARAAGFVTVGVGLPAAAAADGLAPGMLSIVRELRPELVMLRELRGDSSTIAAIARPLAIAGYERAGVDGFALAPRAAQACGHAPPDDGDVVAFGVAAISMVGASCFENHRTVEAYCASLERGQLPVRAGQVLDAGDGARCEIARQIAGAFGVVERAHI